MATDALSVTFAALADPTRRSMLARLGQGEASVTELAEPFALSLQAVSKHLKVLQHAGLVTRSKESRWRPATLNPKPLAEASAWLGDYRTFWDGTFDRLDDHLRTLHPPIAPPGASHESDSA